ncbi:MAG: sulfotransferase family protein [Actinomycetota bacterium]|nr:sulfotransferase family protein [Actinomycetota bacterium]
MAVISRSNGYLFLLAPRTASTAVGDVMCKQLGGNFIPKRDMLDEHGSLIVERKHSTTRKLVDAGLLLRQDVTNLFVITAVRNPFDSLVTWWVKKKTSYVPLLADPNSFIHRSKSSVADIRFVMDHTFDEWVERNYAEAVPRSMYAEWLEDADFVMRYEQLQHDFEEAMGRVGIDQVPPIPVLNRTEAKGADYRSYYTPQSRRLVARAFAPDLERFGYRF